MLRIITILHTVLQYCLRHSDVTAEVIEVSEGKLLVLYRRRDFDD